MSSLSILMYNFFVLNLAFQGYRQIKLVQKKRFESFKRIREFLQPTHHLMEFLD